MQKGNALSLRMSRAQQEAPDRRQRRYAQKGNPSRAADDWPTALKSTIELCVFKSWRLEANGREPMSEHLKGEIWDLAAGTFIAVSVVSGVAYIIASAIH